MRIPSVAMGTGSKSVTFAGAGLILPSHTESNPEDAKLEAARQAIESHTPGWFEDHDLSTGIADEFRRISQLVQAHRALQVPGSRLAQPQGLEESPNFLEKFLEVEARFKLLAMDTFLKPLPNLPLPGQVDYLHRMMQLTDGAHVGEVAEDLHDLVEVTADQLEEPLAEMHQGNVAGFLQATEDLKARTPEWWRRTGVAHSIDTSMGHLEHLFNTYLPSPATVEEQAELASAHARPGKILLPPQSAPLGLLQVPVNVDTLLNGFARYEALKTETHLNKLATEPAPRRFQDLKALVNKAPTMMRQVANRLFQLIKPLSPGIAYLETNQAN